MLLLALAWGLAACSKPAGGELIGTEGDPSAVDRTITLEATNDLKFEPSTLEVSAGETIEFQVENVAEVEHEFVLGPANEHGEGMDHPDDASSTGAIAPGESGTVVWEFTEAGEVQFACYIAQHNEAGMTGTVTVSE